MDVVEQKRGDQRRLTRLIAKESDSRERCRRYGLPKDYAPRSCDKTGGS